jgi:hypothetical protein
VPSRHSPPPPPVILATALRWILHLPQHHLAGTQRPLIGDLRPFEPHPPGPRPLVSCGSLYAGPHPCPISLLPARPSVVPDVLQILHLPMGTLLLAPRGALPVAVLRLLDTLFPSADEYRAPDLWALVEDPAEPPEPPPSDPVDLSTDDSSSDTAPESDSE